MYFYRFLRSQANNLHSSEVDGDIVFYTSGECGTNRDFVCNKPIKEKEDGGQSVQVLFGAENLQDALEVLKCFGCYKRVLARFDISVVQANYSIHCDEQVNERVGSKYIMTNYNGSKISIPDSFVQVLSTCGWIEKEKAANALDEINKLTKEQYENLIINA